MRIGLLGLAICVMVTVAGQAAEPAPSYQKVRVEAGREGRNGFDPGETRVDRTYPGGRRACIIAVGRKRVAIVVQDPAGNIVAQDAIEGDEDRLMTAIWYPPRDQLYTITIQNLNATPVIVTLALR